MTGKEQITGRYWPTPAAYALSVTCVECGGLAFTCPCAVADNDATGQGDEVEHDETCRHDGGHWDAA